MQNDKLISIGEDGWLKIWERSQRKLLHYFQPTSCALKSLSYEPSNRIICVGSERGEIFVFRAVPQWTQVCTLKETNAQILCLNFLNGKIVISGTDNGQLGFWDIELGLKVGSINIHQPIKVVEAINQRKGFVACGKSIKFWDYDSFQIIKNLENIHQKEIQMCTLEDQKGKLYTAANDGYIKAWNLYDFQCTWYLFVGNDIQGYWLLENDRIFIWGKKGLASYNRTDGKIKAIEDFKDVSVGFFVGDSQRKVGFCDCFGEGIIGQIFL